MTAGEAMEFIDEEYGGCAIGGESIGGGIEEFADILDAGRGGIESFEVSACVSGDEFCECGFAGAWGSVEDHGADAIGGEHSAEQFAFAEDVLLTAEFGDCLWPHACSEWFGGIAVLLFSGGEEVHCGGAGGDGSGGRRLEIVTIGPRVVILADSHAVGCRGLHFFFGRGNMGGCQGVWPEGMNLSLRANYVERASPAVFVWLFVAADAVAGMC